MKKFTSVLVLILIFISLLGLYKIKNNRNYKEYELFNLPKREVDLLVLVNYENKLDKGFYINLSDYDSFKVSSVMLDDLNTMYKNAKKDGITLYINNAYRTQEEQENIFNQTVNKYIKEGYTKSRSISLTKQYVSTPGYSEHHTGLAIDFSKKGNYSINNKMWNWLKKNASKYGFILRYPTNKTNITKVSYEPWHYRYVGKYHAKRISINNLTLEEYIEKELNAS